MRSSEGELRVPVRLSKNLTKRRFRAFSIAVLVVGFALFGCARGPIKKPHQSLRLTDIGLVSEDDLGFSGFRESLEGNIQALEKNKSFEMQFGPYRIPRAEYLRSLKKVHETLLQDEARSDVTFSLTRQFLQDHFQYLEVYGQREWGEIFMTSYFEPIIPGSATRTEKFSQPLYGVPRDMVFVRVYDFAEKFPQLLARPDLLREKKFQEGLRGRLVETKSPQLPQILPYYSRAEIDSSESPLSKVAQVIAWVDPVDAFFLQIQGSGRVLFESHKDSQQARRKNKKGAKPNSVTEVRVIYAGQNGHQYEAIGQYLFDVIPREKMSMQAIEAHLRGLSPLERQQILNKNPSYVFFEKSERRAVTYFGTEAQAGRTIATDAQYFPKGALAFLQFEKPVFENENSIDPVSRKKVSRFVFDQDTGGAIKGPGRVDLFWGSGSEAKQHSGVIRNHGRLYYLLPKFAISR